MKHSVRIELLGGNDEQHQALAAALRREGFERSVTARDGTRYRLPDGQWSYEAKATVNDVLDTAKRAAASTGCACRIVVTEVAGQAWHNLDAEG